MNEAVPTSQIVLTQNADFASVIDNNNKIIEVTIIKPGPTKHEFPDYTISYTEESLKQSLPIWDGVACFCDHFDKSVKNIVGVFYDPFYENGVKAKLRFLDSALYNFACQLIRDREEDLPVPDVGISADIGIRTINKDHTQEVVEITRVISADIVFSPAAGGSFDRILNETCPELAERIGISPHFSSPDAIASDKDDIVQRYEKRVRDLQSQNDKLRNQINERNALLSQYDDLKKEHRATLLAFKEALLKANSSIPEELLNTSTLAELETSFKNAEQVVQKIKESIKGQEFNIPAGSPIRAEPDTNSLSPREKIKHGLQRR
jgi:phosphopantetheinyl transferase (holo-ACP synthase)